MQRSTPGKAENGASCATSATLMRQSKSAVGIGPERAQRQICA